MFNIVSSCRWCRLWNHTFWWSNYASIALALCKWMKKPYWKNPETSPLVIRSCSFEWLILIGTGKILISIYDFSDKLKSIFNEAGVFQGIIYVLLLKLSANLTKNHGIAPGGEFRRALKEVWNIKINFPAII